MNYYFQYDNHYGNQYEIIKENEYLNNLVQHYIQQIQKLKLKNEKLIVENKLLREFMEKNTPSIHIASVNLSHDINLDKLRVNSIQSGAALNIAEGISNSTNSDMEMALGPNSMNNGDYSQMEYGFDNPNGKKT